MKTSTTGRKQKKPIARHWNLQATNHEARLRLGLLFLRSASLRKQTHSLPVQRMPGSAKALYYRGQIAVIEGPLAEAEEHFTAAWALNTHSSAALMGLGKIALRREDWELAIRLFDQASQQATGSSAPAIVGNRAAAGWRDNKKHRRNSNVYYGLDPLNHLALYEMASGNYPESRRSNRSCSKSCRTMISTLWIWHAITWMLACRAMRSK